MHKKGFVVVPIAKMSKYAEDLSETSDEVLHGTEVYIMEETQNGYVKIQTEYNYSGFVPVWAVCMGSYADEGRCIITNMFADVLSEPKVQAVIQESLPMGSFIKVVSNDADNNYAYVALADGRKGFARKNFIANIQTKVDNEVELRDAIANTALKYKGAQYRWGGKTHLGIDCSGLCFMSYFINGITIFRDSNLQDPVKQIDKANIQKADLIYFKGHIGMYLNDGNMIHSSDSQNGVEISPIDWENVIKIGSVWSNKLTFSGSSCIFR